MLKHRRLLTFLITAMMVISTCFGVLQSKIDAYAEDVSIILAIWPSEAQNGDLVTATVTISGENLGDFDIFLEYPSELLSYNAGDTTGSIEIQGHGTNTLSYTFTAVADGTGKIQTSGYKIYDTDGVQLSVVHAGGTIAVGQVEESEDKITIGNEVYTLVNEKKLPSPPEGYTISSVTYGEKEIYAYQAPNQNIKVVCLQNAEWEQKWFVFDEESQEFSPYVQYTMDGISYVVINKPSDVEIPEYYSETSLTLEGMTLVAYTDESDNGLYLVYALNQTGDAGLYFFDSNEGSFIRYDAVESLVEYQNSNYVATDSEDVQESAIEETTEVTKATPLIPKSESSNANEEEEGVLSKGVLQKLLYMMVVLFIVMCVVVIVLVVRIGMLQSQLYGEDYDDDDEDEIVNKARKDAKKTVEQEVKEEAEPTEEVKQSNDAISQSQIKKGKSNKYSVNEDTGEILLVEAADNNSGVKVPPAEDVDPSKIAKAMAERPYGYDSAFDVVTVDEAPEGDHVYREPEPETDQLIDPSRFDAELERRNLNAANMLKALREEDNNSEELDDTEEDSSEELAFDEIPADDSSKNKVHNIPLDIDEPTTEILISDEAVRFNASVDEPTTEILISDEQIAEASASNDEDLEEEKEEKEEKKSGGFLSKRKRQRKNRRNKKNKNKEQVEENENESLVSKQPVKEEPVVDIAEAPTEVLVSPEFQKEQSESNQDNAGFTDVSENTVKKNKKKKDNTPQKVALPGMNDEEDE